MGISRCRNSKEETGGVDALALLKKGGSRWRRFVGKCLLFYRIKSEKGNLVMTPRTMEPTSTAL
jgi:hypothetical protein